MRWTDEMRIETPEQIEVDLELAGLGSRFLAQLIDWCWKLFITFILGVLAAIIAGLAGFGGRGGRGRGDDLFDNPPALVIAVVIAAIYIIWFTYGVFFEIRWNGQTPGKRAAGIRVIQVGGAPLDFRTAGIRNLMAVADFIPVFYILGAVLILLTDRKQRLGDLAAGTIVVRERAEILGPDSTDELTEHATGEYRFTPLQLSALTRNDRMVIREFLRRYDGMDRRSWQRLAQKMADTFVQKTGYELTDYLDGTDARAFLASLLRDLDEKLRHD
ncbi:MAG: RDD family protein [Planctomycetes bacterium]|nr:RDD family protein [Planctomycetota bacterium]